jgi:hypothetical protein
LKYEEKKKSELIASVSKYQKPILEPRRRRRKPPQKKETPNPSKVPLIQNLMPPKQL